MELAGTRRALEAASRQQQEALATAQRGGSQQLQRVQAQARGYMDQGLGRLPREGLTIGPETQSSHQLLSTTRM